VSDGAEVRCDVMCRNSSSNSAITVCKFLSRGAVICNMAPTQGNRDAFSARLKQSGVSVQVARVAAGNWFQSCGSDTANARRSSVATRGTQRLPYGG